MIRLFSISVTMEYSVDVIVTNFTWKYFQSRITKILELKKTGIEILGKVVICLIYLSKAR